MTTKSNKLFEPALVQTALKESFIKLNPQVMLRNPVMFTVEIGTAVMLFVSIYSFGHRDQGTFGYNFAIFIILFLTVLFANFAEAIAEARGKAQADSLRKTREETPANLVSADGSITSISSNQLKKGDVFVCESGDTIPIDGEIIEGLATIDESAITGESAPVIRESGGDKSSVTGGTKVLSDKIKVIVTTEPGESFLDKMIALVEGASRQKNTKRNSADHPAGQFYADFYHRLRNFKTLCRLCAYANNYRRFDFAFCLFDPNHNWRFVICDWYRRDGQGIACQRNYQIWQSCGNCRRY